MASADERFAVKEGLLSSRGGLGRTYGRGVSMVTIRYAGMEDKDFWYRLDKHLPEAEFENKVKVRQGYVLLEHDRPVGLLRYNLFWDSKPFCTMLFIDETARGKGYGSALMRYWEEDMKKQGHGMVLTSTQTDETAQHFYRKAGYKECGCLIIDIPRYAQPMEMFFVKEI